MIASSASMSWGGSFSARPVSTTIRPAWLHHYLPRSPPPLPPHRPAPGQAVIRLRRLFLAALHGFRLALLIRRLGTLGLRLRFRLFLGWLLLCSLFGLRFRLRLGRLLF